MNSLQFSNELATEQLPYFTALQSYEGVLITNAPDSFAGLPVLILSCGLLLEDSMEPCIYIIADGFGVTIDKDNVEFFDLLQGPFVILDLRERTNNYLGLYVGSQV